VTGYNDDGYTYSPVTHNPCTYGSGGLRSLARDLVKFMPQYVNPTLISKKTMDEICLHIPPLADGTVTNYACGLRINQMLGHTYYHHGGVNAGFRSFTVIFPDDDLVIAVSTNTYNIPIETAGRDIARIVLGLPERVRKNLDEYTTDSVDLDSIPGYYYNYTSQKCFEFKVEDGQVFVSNGSRFIPLVHVRGNLYKMGRRDITFAFGEKITANQEGAICTAERLTAEPEDINCYVGSYYCPEVKGTYQFYIEDGKLTMRNPSGGKDELHLVAPDEFCYGSMSDNGCHMIFTRNEAGQIVNVKYTAPQITELVFEKQ